eukprot:581631-Rhodomonas_salina.1
MCIRDRYEDLDPLFRPQNFDEVARLVHDKFWKEVSRDLEAKKEKAVSVKPRISKQAKNVRLCKQTTE